MMKSKKCIAIAVCIIFLLSIYPTMQKKRQRLSSAAALKHLHPYMTPKSIEVRRPEHIPDVVRASTEVLFLEYCEIAASLGLENEKVLRPGLSESAIVNLEQKFETTLPEEVKILYSIADGESLDRVHACKFFSQERRFFRWNTH